MRFRLRTLQVVSSLWNVMEVTLVFRGSFATMMRAKWRYFRRRSVWRYAIASALLGLGVSFMMRDHFDLQIFFLTWLTSIISLCGLIWLFHLISAVIQTRPALNRIVTFTENAIHVTHNSKTIATDWNWIISAEDERDILTLLISKWPRRELYVNRHFLEEEAYHVLYKWLVQHGKLRPTISASTV